MTQVPLVALKPLIYGGRRYVPGDEFTARGQSDARVLIAIGKADFATADMAPEPETVRVAVAAPAAAAAPADDAKAVEAAPAQPAAQTEQPAAEQLELAPDADAPAAEARPRRTYRRRDMQSEGGAG